jgi:hypothetical protein
MQYNPIPIDGSWVGLPPELLRLVESLARNGHDVWARQRIAEGWRYGPVRDDAGKTHPCLIPFDELPESEKEYDRKTAAETIKTIVALGFVLTPNTG